MPNDGQGQRQGRSGHSMCSQKLTRTPQVVDGVSYAFQDPLMTPFASSTRQPQLSTRTLIGPADDDHRNDCPEVPQPGQPMLVRCFSRCIYRKLTRAFRLPHQRYIHHTRIISKVGIAKTHMVNQHTLSQSLCQCVFSSDLIFRRH